MPFGYFGSKRRLAPTYPAARLDTIIEPFAGAAAYSLLGDHWLKDVILIDNNPDVVAVWRWLQQATTADLLGLPHMEQAQQGQIIVVEQSPAAWLPFEHHATHRTTSNNPVSELIWTNEPRLRLFTELGDLQRRMK